ncbi:MAG TPA: bifunctional glutamate N-acetyltransferase/amino-acid acetyltransferase ArgJ [Acidimicrobiales bacterium]|nr:bifunctional glutamate N-acetyltransferase/amino-acid acetyltransferase ArgJ [Acidimicrobiales bacterium]
MSITTPRGFVAAGISAGVKASGALDLALVATDDGAAVPTAATFTTNLAAAAPVQVSRAHMAATGGRAAGVLVSSGNANAATGDRGRADATAMCALAADGLGVPVEQVLVCSTGLIGIPLPMEPIADGIPRLVAARAGGDAAGADAAAGILTTDSGRKEVLVEYPGFTVAGMAKGAGMLAPDMATMLAFLTTDAAVEPGPLGDILRAAVADSFNSMSVDGCTSTNDTVVLLASGRAGRGDPSLVADAVAEACADLAGQMAADAEGADTVFQVHVSGARSDAEAHRAARKVADSLLVKCSINGKDPYWGRVASELGSAGVDFDMDRLTIAYGGTAVCRGGIEIPHDAAAVAAHMAGPLVSIECGLGLADGTGVVLGVELGYGYIDENRTTS